MHETVELPPVHEEDFNVEDEIDIHEDPVTPEPAPDEPQDTNETEEPARDTQLLDEPQDSNETEEPSPDEQLPDEPQDFFLNESKPVRLKKDDMPAHEPEQPEEPLVSEAEPQEPEEPAITEQEPQEPEEPALSESEPDLPEELSAEPEQAQNLGELLPDSMEHPDPELADAFNTMEEKLDEHIAASNEQPESELDITEDEDFSEGEKMPFTEIPADENEVLADIEIPAADGEILPEPEIIVVEENDALPDLGISADAKETLPELELPDELDDDEIIDDIDEAGEDNKAN